MRTIWAIYRADLRRARRSVISLVVVLGLTAIPALFTWFNVAASWDPFSNTKNLTIAIANTDQGYKSDLVPLTVNIGDQVVAALRANEDFDWAIESEEGAVEKTRSGQYYAAVVIPADFSKDMMTFFSSPDARSAPLTAALTQLGAHVPGRWRPLSGGTESPVSRVRGCCTFEGGAPASRSGVFRTIPGLFLECRFLVFELPCAERAALHMGGFQRR